MLKDANIESHLKEISRLSALHHEAEQAIAVARAESDQMTIRIAQLENQVSQQTETAGLRALEIQQANDRWLLMETRMETMASDMLDAKLTIKQTAELTAQAANTSNASNNEATESGEASMVLPEGQIAIDPSTLDALNSKITDLTNELDILQNRNSHLEASATTMVERHRKGELVCSQTFCRPMPIYMHTSPLPYTHVS